MSNLKALKNRIQGVKSTEKITKAMKMVAASKLRRAREQAESAVHYASAMQSMLTSLAHAVSDANFHPLLSESENKTCLFIVVTSDKGLCGNLNSSLVRSVKKALLEQEKYKILCIGNKGYELLREVYKECIVDHQPATKKELSSFTHAKEIADYALALFEKGEVGSCMVYYSKFKSVISQEVTREQLMPLDVSMFHKHEKQSYECEPSAEKILAELLPRNLIVQIQHALLESAASEQGARMRSMDQATRNAGQMIIDLSMLYNRSRQASITTELIEIIAGAEALQ